MIIVIEKIFFLLPHTKDPNFFYMNPNPILFHLQYACIIFHLTNIRFLYSIIPIKYSVSRIGIYNPLQLTFDILYILMFIFLSVNIEQWKDLKDSFCASKTSNNKQRKQFPIWHEFKLGVVVTQFINIYVRKSILHSNITYKYILYNNICIF